MQKDKQERGALLLESDNYRQFLVDELTRRVRNNPRYSQRAFSKQLGLSPGELSEILNGKRDLSLKSVLRIADSLGLNATETKHLTLLVQIEKTKDLGQDSLLKSGKAFLNDLPTSQKISHDLFSVVADWYHFAILNLAETERFDWSDKWIAKRLGITRNEANFALKRLEKVGLIKKDKAGKLTVTKDYVQTMEGIPSEAGRRYHQQILQKALVSLDLQKLNEREIAGISFPVNLKSIPAIKKDISQFLDEVAAKYSKDRKSQEVYHLELCLFRLSEGNDHV